MLPFCFFDSCAVAANRVVLVVPLVLVQLRLNSVFRFRTMLELAASVPTDMLVFGGNCLPNN
jgi:hypothetical protein